MSTSLSILADQQIVFAKEAFSPFGEVTLADGRSINNDALKKTDVLLVRSVTQVNESLLHNTPVKFVGSATSGIDHIDLDYLKNSDIHFTHAPGSNARSVAEYVLSCLFTISELQDFSLTEKTVGSIGYGQVGSRLKHFLDSLGVECLINDPPLADKTSKEEFIDLDEITKADIISLHVPLDSDRNYPTRNLINKSFLSKLKQDVVLINTSRGEVINENDLLSFKKTNPGATLVLDVWCNEPNINLELLQQTLIATPHIAGYSLDGKLKATQMLFNELNTFANTELTNNVYDILNHTPEKFDLNENSIQVAVMRSYDVRTDAVGLRNLPTLEQEERPDYFDSLRINYPIRREFDNRLINTNHLNKKTENQLKELGFNLGN